MDHFPNSLKKLIMRKIILLAASAILVSGSFAQTINRTHPPKPGPAPEIKLDNPAVFQLKNGIKVLVVENHKVPSISASYFVYTGPIKEGEKAGVMNLMGGMLNEGTQTMSKAAFDQAAEQDGTSINLNSSGGYISALNRYFEKGLSLLADGLQNPAMQQAAFDKLKSQSLSGLKIAEKSINTIAQNVTGALAYGKTSPLGEFETSASIKSIQLADVKSYYSKYITPSSGYLTIVGDIQPKEAQKLAEKYFANWKGASVTVAKVLPVDNPAKTEIDLVDVPTAVQSVINVTNVISLPLDSKDYFAALIANQILGGGADAYLFKDLREKHGYTYGAYSSIAGGIHQTRFNASASVRNAVTDSSVLLLLGNIQKLRSEKVSEDLLKDTKAVFNGNFALGTENPSRIAGFARNIMIYNLPEDYYRNYLQKINAVTAADVQRVAGKYFNHDNTRIVIAGKADSILPGLKKLGFPVKLYDNDANPVLVSDINQGPTASAETIINHYLSAIGGKEHLAKIKSIAGTGNMKIQTMEIPFITKKMAPNLELMEMSMNGKVVSKSVFDGKAGYQEQMGQKKAFEPGSDEIKKYGDMKGVFEQAFYQDGSYKLATGKTTKINGSDAYQLSVTGASGNKSVEYYDVKSGLLVQSESTVTSNGQTMTMRSAYSDYKKVGDVLLPYNQTLTVSSAAGEQVLEMVYTDFKLNEGVSAEDFK